MSERPSYEDFLKRMESSQMVNALMNSAAERFELERFSDVKAICEEILEINPDHSDSFHLLGLLAHQVGNNNEALSLINKAVEIDPQNPIYCNNLGTAFREVNELDKAFLYFQRAIDLRPDFPEAHNNMGVCLKTMGRPEEAIFHLQKAVDLKPDFLEALNSLVDQLQAVCAWRDLEDAGAKLDDLTNTAIAAGSGPAEDPMISLRRHDDLARNLAVARSRSRQIATDMSQVRMPFSFDEWRSSKERITVGYLSNNFRNHPVAHQISSLFGMHNRDDFQIHCYSYGRNDHSDYRRDIERSCDEFVDISQLSCAEAAKYVYRNQVDILVDLVGHTQGNRMGIVALRPAPIQVSYLGFLGTTGAEFIDYMIADKTVIPEDHASYYSEKLVYLPDCYQVNNNSQPVSKKKFNRSDFGLPADHFVFCSFNNAYKLEPVIFDIWMDILQEVPESVLWLLRENEVSEKNLRDEAGRRGIGQERLFFANRLPLDEHLARLVCADLALDTKTYNGGATTSNALWVNIPVVTLQGEHFVSRMSSSALKAVGLPELITNTLAEYKALAVRLALNPGELKAIKLRLGKNRLHEPLFDTIQFSGNLEKAFRKMWQVFLEGKNPIPIDVADG